jgi:hypothetical protein
VLGALINYHNMRRLNGREMAQANKHLLMAALTYHLKKYLKFISKKANAQVLAMNGKDRSIFKCPFAKVMRRNMTYLPTEILPFLVKSNQAVKTLLHLPVNR